MYFCEYVYFVYLYIYIHTHTDTCRDMCTKCTNAPLH
jgi:hypothetical protein